MPKPSHLSLPARAALASLRGLERLSPPLAAAAAERVSMSPRRFGPPSRERRVRSRAHRFPIPWDLGALRGYRWGDPRAPVVLLVHGWEGRGTQLASFVDPLCTAGFGVIAFDGPGHGRSAGTGPITLPRFADAIAAAVRTVGPVHGVIAHSFGAASTAYALASGLGVQRAVFVAPVDPGLSVRRFCGYVGLSEAVQLEMERRLEARYGLPLEHFQASQMAARGRVPLLVVHDRTDRIVPHDDGEAWATSWPDALLWSTEGLGHARILRAPEVIQRTTAFLTEARAVA